MLASSAEMIFACALRHASAAGVWRFVGARFSRFVGEFIREHGANQRLDRRWSELFCKRGAYRVEGVGGSHGTTTGSLTTEVK